jgi:glyoxylase-like metal-dependent hydrolase (beta-lactamase superfamily II)
MQIRHFFDTATSTLTYVVYDKVTKDAVVIDPVLDYDPASVTTSIESISVVQAFVKEQQLNVHLILETHAHADHLSGAKELVKRFLPNAKIGIGERITLVQKTFKEIFNFPSSFKTDGSQFHRLFKNNETVKVGSLGFKVLFTPGHTPACASYLFDGFVFSGDALFMPDSGTGRCDFPQGDAHDLYRSISKCLYALPDNTRVFVGHDYQPGGRPLMFETTIGESKKRNIQITASTSEENFVQLRKARDAVLSAPRLLFPSVQVNIAAGELPAPEENGRIYLKLPVTKKMGSALD